MPRDSVLLSFVRGSTASLRTRLGVVGLMGGLLLTLTGPAMAHDATTGVQPGAVSTSLDPGESTDITKTVHTSPVPPNPDITFLADTTGSMGGEIANVKANVASIMTDVQAAEPTAQFGVAQYKDFNCGIDPFAFNVDQTVTDDTTAVQNAVNTWTTPSGSGCDTPEAQLFALHKLADPAVTGWRTGGTRIIAWFGDAPGHDPSGGVTLTDTINALTGSEVRVVAVSTGFNQLNSTGQATAITDATDGVLLSGVSASDVSAAILEGIEAIPVTVTPQVDACDDGLSLAFSPGSQTVTSGEDATFTETISVATDAPQGQTLSCTVSFLIDGNPQGPEFTQTVDITVNDVTPPEVACSPTTNPDGGNVPKAGNNPTAGQNPDGFYELTANDNVDDAPDIYLRDTGSGTVFGPFEDGTKVKYTEDPDATPEQKPMGGPNSAVRWHIIGNGDAEIFAEDSSGNVSAPRACLVPGPPK